MIFTLLFYQQWSESMKSILNSLPIKTLLGTLETYVKPY